jgi:glutamine amidotransferase
VASAPVPRWGLGYVQSGQVLLSRTPRASETDVDLWSPLDRVTADYLVVHACDEDGLRGSVNTQPFRFRRWMFAVQDNTLAGGFEQIHDGVLEHIPDFLRRNLKGKTPAEHVFHLFLSFLHDSGLIDDVNLDPADARRALRDTLALLLSMNARAGGKGAPGNIMLSNGRMMVAARLEEPLFLRRLKVAPVDKEPESFRGVLALSASENPGQGFEEIPKRSVLEISRDLDIQIASLDA